MDGQARSGGEGMGRPERRRDSGREEGSWGLHGDETRRNAGQLGAGGVGDGERTGWCRRVFVLQIWNGKPWSRQ